MEIRFEHVSFSYPNNQVLKDINLTINKNIITGLYGNNKTTILKLIDLVYAPHEGLIYYDSNKVNSSNLKSLRKKIAFIKNINDNTFYTNNLINEISFIKENYNYPFNIVNKSIQTLKIVGLEQSILNRNFNELSEGELKLIQIAIALITNPQVLLFDEPFERLDFNHKKNIIKLINKLKRDYNKTIIIASNDPDLLFSYTDQLIIINNDQLLINAKTEEAFIDEELFKKLKIEIPRIMQFINLAKRKDKKLLIRTKINDLIKDVYRDV